MNSDRTCNSSSWTKEEDKAFETALAIYSGDSDLFMKIAAALPQKSLQEIEQHHNDLIDDINDIESGKVPLPQYPRMQSRPSRRNRLPGAEVKRQKGIAWTAEEHRLFLKGLEKYGRGDWRSISRNYVLSRTPTQVASHAQKFFSRLNDVNNGKRRRSIHDITSVDANTIGPSQGQIPEKLIGPCGGHLQCPITDYVTEAFETGMPSSQGSATNCVTASIEGPSAVNPAKFPFGAADVSWLNSSLPVVDDEFLQDIEDLIMVPADGTSEAWCKVDGRTPPLLGSQPSIEGGTGTYSHPVNSVVDELEEVITKQFPEATEIGRTVNTARLPWSNADHIGVHGCPASSKGDKNGFEISGGAPEEGFSFDSKTLPSVPRTSRGVYPSLNATINAAPEGGFSGDSRTLPSIPGTSGGVYSSLNATINAAPEGGFSGDSRTLSSIFGTSGGVYPSLNATINAAPEGGFSSDSRTLPSILGTSGVVHPSLNATINAAPEGGFSGDFRTLPSIPGTSDGVNPSLSGTTKDDNISNWQALFPDHIIKYD